jgi:signal transduction histidine kinase
LLKFSRPQTDTFSEVDIHRDPGGHIMITTSCDDAGFIVEFRDSGSGIAAKNIPKILNPFSQPREPLQTGEQASA